MALIGSAEYLVEATGVQETAQSLQVFAENVSVSMDSASVATEAASKSAGASVVAYAALGAAIGVVFIDFIRQSSVMSTLTSSFGAVMGALADSILIAFVPGLVKIINKLVELRPEMTKLVSKMVDDLIPAFEDTVEAVGDVSAAFFELDDDTQKLTVSIGLLLAGFTLIAVGRPVLGATSVIAAFGINLEGITETITSSGEQLAQLSHDFQTFFTVITPRALAQTAGQWNDFAHNVQVALADAGAAISTWAHDARIVLIEFGVDIAAAVAPAILAVQGAWEGLVGWFQALWDDITFAADIAWAGISTTFQSAWDGIVGFFSGFISQLTGPLETFVNAFIDGINLLIAGLNAISFGVAAIPAIPHLDLAKGAIVTSPTIAMIGEAGPEAVIPLTGPIPRELLAPVLQAALTVPGLELGGEVLTTGAAIVHRGEQFLGGGGRASGGLTLHMTNYFSFAGGARGGADIRADIGESMDRAAERFMTKVRRRQ